VCSALDQGYSVSSRLHVSRWTTPAQGAMRALLRTIGSDRITIRRAQHEKQTANQCRVRKSDWIVVAQSFMGIDVPAKAGTGRTAQGIAAGPAHLPVRRLAAVAQQFHRNDASSRVGGWRPAPTNPGADIASTAQARSTYIRVYNCGSSSGSRWHRRMCRDWKRAGVPLARAERPAGCGWRRSCPGHIAKSKLLGDNDNPLS